MPSFINLKNGSSFGYREENLFDQRSDCSPGPVYHTTKLTEEERMKKLKNTCRGFGFGEKNVIYKSSNNVPGPGSYYEENSSDKKFRTSPTSSTFGKSPRNMVSKSNPLGPG